MANQTFLDSLTQQLTTAALAAFPELQPTDFRAEVTQSTNPRFGHYQCNSAMKLAKELGENPRAVAKIILDNLEGEEMVEGVEIAGPGFLNITLAVPFLERRLRELAADPRLGVPKVAESQRIIVEFSSPNIAKEMHVGHLRSTIIGDAIARLLEFLGHDVLRLNHVGDWGTQFGMLIAYLKRTGQRGHDLTELVGFYREARGLFDADPSFKKEAQLEVVELQGGNPDSLKAWEQICALSRQAFEEIYDLLDVRLTERGESYYNSLLPVVVADLEKKGLVEISEGAKCIYLNGFVSRAGEPLPMIIQKSDGGYNYSTTDMAAIRQRVEEERADWIIVVTDAGQATHFQMIFKAAQAAGYIDPARVRLDHVTFGLVLGADGKKFRTRAGETEKLMDLLTTAMIKARTILQERNRDLTPQEVEEIAHALGIGAVKYADLSGNRTQDYTFSYDRMLRFEGNTAAFLLYAYVRVHGIKRKIGVEPKDVPIHLEHPTEQALALHLCQFGEALDLVSRDLLPNRLTDYLYRLAELFHAFFRDCRVEGSELQESRLLLCEAVAGVMRKGLELLGLRVVEKM